VGAYGGRREIMSGGLAAGGVYQAGTLSGNPLAVAGGLAAIRGLADGRAYARLETLGARLEQGLRAGADKAGVPLTVNRVGSMLTAFFARHRSPTTPPPQADTARYAKFFSAMLERGMYLAPSQSRPPSSRSRIPTPISRRLPGPAARRCSVTFRAAK